jgi:hypothetical protein
VSKKFLFVDTEGFYEESAGAFEESDHVNTSAGAGDAGKPIVLDAAGKISNTMIDATAIDHGSLSGLLDDDHTQYILVDGTRAFSSDQSMGSNKLTNLGDATAATDAVPLGQLDSTATGEGASLIGIEDAAGNFTAVNVEGALAEIAAASTGKGVSYIADAGGSGVSKGDLVYISSADSADVVTLSTNKGAVGLADASVAASASFTALANDNVVSGILVGATAGNTYFWDGATHTTTIPPGSGAYVWRTGYAKNATDLHVEVKFLKRNSI